MVMNIGAEHCKEAKQKRVNEIACIYTYFNLFARDGIKLRLYLNTTDNKYY